MTEIPGRLAAIANNAPVVAKALGCDAEGTAKAMIIAALGVQLLVEHWDEIKQMVEGAN
jgi:hypothetical protein